jgi:hypothetical protein
VRPTTATPSAGTPGYLTGNIDFDHTTSVIKTHWRATVSPTGAGVRTTILKERIMRINFRHLILSSLAVLWAVACAVPAQAAAPENVPFINGGVGEDQRLEMLAARKDYNLLLTFATRGSGEFVADVRLTVTDHAGKTVLRLDAAGPLVYARVAPGNYKVEAVARGVTQTQAATVARQGARDVYFYWAPDAPTQQ